MKRIIFLALTFFATASFAGSWKPARGIKAKILKDKACVTLKVTADQHFVDKSSGERWGTIPKGAFVNICQLQDENSLSAGPLVLINPTEEDAKMRFGFVHQLPNGDCDTAGPMYLGTYQDVPAKSNIRINMTALGDYSKELPEDFCYGVQMTD